MQPCMTVQNHTGSYTSDPHNSMPVGFKIRKTLLPTPLYPTRSPLRIVSRLATPSFSVSFRTPGPARPGIPKFQISTNSTHPAGITHDPRKIRVQNRSKFFNMMKIQIKIDSPAKPGKPGGQNGWRGDQMTGGFGIVDKSGPPTMPTGMAR